MQSNDRYCLDADALITPKNGPYRFDIWPEFWEWLVENVRSGRVYSCWKVYDEWRAGQDDLSEWVVGLRHEGLAEPSSAGVQEKLKDIVQYVEGTYAEHHAASFLSGADPWVIAHVWEDGSTLVTFEKARSPQAKKVKIPNVCHRYGIRCVNLYDMLAELKGIK